ncbi:MAG: ATP-binding protein, partial [Geopsychrobacter sp.]|nr:ATP-binding protein [Geopsychrobacter sp.]
MDNKKHSIIRRLTLSLTLAIGVVSFVASGLLALNAAQKGQRELTAEVEKSIVLLTRTLKEPLWDLDEKRIFSVGEVYKEDPRVTQLNILDNANRPIYSFQRKTNSASIQRTGKITHAERVIGSVQISFSKAAYLEGVWQIIQSTIVINLLILITVFATTGFMIRIYLRRPLYHLTEIVNCYTAEDYSPSPDKITSVEFQPFGKVLTLMGEKIHQQFKALQEEIIVREQAETEMRTLQNYLKNVVDSMPSVLIGVDKDGLVTQWNKGAATMTKLSAEQVQGKYLPDVFPQMSAEMEMIKQSIREGVLHKDSTVSRRQGDETKYSDLTIYPLIANGVEGAVIRLDDVTERVRIEEMMVQSEKMMSIGGMAAGMAHEINNPLSIIGQSAENMKRRLSPSLPANQKIAHELDLDLEQLQRYLEKRNILKYSHDIKAAVERAAGIVSNMLNFSAVSQSSNARCTVSSIVETCLALINNDFELKKQYNISNVKICVDIEENLPLIEVNKSEIEQVIFNLLKNAVQAMNTDKIERTPQLFIKAEQIAHWIKISVQDNGPGMDEARQRRIFEPFYTTKAPGVGTGLGLSVSYYIITKRHQGQLTVSSVVGEG